MGNGAGPGKVFARFKDHFFFSGHPWYVEEYDMDAGEVLALSLLPLFRCGSWKCDLIDFTTRLDVIFQIVG